MTDNVLEWLKGPVSYMTIGYLATLLEGIRAAMATWGLYQETRLWNSPHYAGPASPCP